MWPWANKSQHNKLSLLDFTCIYDIRSYYSVCVACCVIYDFVLCYRCVVVWLVGCAIRPTDPAGPTPPPHGARPPGHHLPEPAPPRRRRHHTTRSSSHVSHRLHVLNSYRQTFGRNNKTKNYLKYALLKKKCTFSDAHYFPSKLLILKLYP